MAVGFGTNTKTNDSDNTSPPYSQMSGKPIGTQTFQGLYDNPQHNGSQVITVPGLHTATDVSYNKDHMNSDENDLSFSDITGAISGAGQAVYDAGKSALQQAGIISKDKPADVKPTTPSSTKPTEVKPTTPSVKVPKITDQNAKQIAAMQEFFKTDIVKNFIGTSYNGNVDGVVNSNVRKIAGQIEDKLEDIVGTNMVHGLVLYTTPDDVKEAIQKALEYKSTKKVAFVLNTDDRILSLYNHLKK